MPVLNDPHKAAPYRPDIDGLRAVAVLLVVLFHIGSPFTGGFIGVDVFFVISGYLITSVILSGMAADRFTLAGFYERRIRRIFPALAVMLAVTSLLAWHYFIPTELAAYGHSQLAALLSISNLLFRDQAGYFDTPNIFKPLLHTWSLGVEEQFYLAFPLLLLLIQKLAPRKLPRILPFTLACLALLSFVCAVLTVRRDPNAAFYDAPLRAWELLTGALLSLRLLPSIRSSAVRNGAAALGLALILYPALRYTNGTPFPGLAALLPCLGAALVIAAGESGTTLIGRALSLRPVVFIGLISYSLYLWHWPLLAFQRSDVMLFRGAAWTWRTKLAFLVLSIAVATLSYFFVERPFRTGRSRPHRPALFANAALAAAALAFVSIALYRRDGFPARFPLAAQTVGAYAAYDRAASTRDGICFLQPSNGIEMFRPDICLAQRPGRKSILLAGDSHAAALFPGLQQVFSDRDILQANVSSCRPAPVQPAGSPAVCTQLNAFLFNQFLPAHHIDTLLLAAKWSPSDFGALAETIRFARAHNIPVVLAGPGIEFDQPLPRLLAIAIRDRDPVLANLHRSLDPQLLDRSMATLAATEWHVPYISIYQDLCTPTCPLYAGAGVPLLFDAHHFTAAGSALLARAIRDRNQLP